MYNVMKFCASQHRLTKIFLVMTTKQMKRSSCENIISLSSKRSVNVESRPRLFSLSDLVAVSADSF